MNTIDPFRKYLQNIGEATPQSKEQLRLMELDCEERKDPNSFYLTFNVSNPPVISWSHNADRHLGVETLDYQGYFSRIHPTWFPLHGSFGSAAYDISRRIFEKDSELPGVYTTNVPIKHADDNYHWYNQVSIPATFDEKGQLVGHLNQYHRLCPFDRLIPSPPKMSVGDEWKTEYDQDFAKAGNSALIVCLNRLLTPANYRILSTYRKLTKASDGKWVSPAKKTVREELGLSPTAINKANVRIIQSLKGEFPNSVTHDVAGFTVFLNDLCGAP